MNTRNGPGPTRPGQGNSAARLVYQWPGTSLLVTDVRPWGGPLSDLVLDGARITRVCPAGAAPAITDRIDGGGRLGIPSVPVAEAVLREFLRHGTTATRSHVDVDLGIGLRGIEAVREAEDRLDGAVDVEIVAFPQDGVIRRPGVLALLDAASRAGASRIGGIDPAGIDRDPVAQLDALFDLAERRAPGSTSTCTTAVNSVRSTTN